MEEQQAEQQAVQLAEQQAEQLPVILVNLTGLHMVLSVVIQLGVNLVLTVQTLKPLMAGIVQDVSVLVINLVLSVLQVQ